MADKKQSEFTEATELTGGWLSGHIAGDNRKFPTTLVAPATHVHDHGSMTGLADDDHTIYVPVNGSRPVASLSVTAGGTVDGRDVSADGAVLDTVATTIANATAEATPSRVIVRDADGRAKVADPAVAADIANRGWTLAALTPSGVGLGNVTNDLQVRAALNYTAKGSPSAGDKMVILDQADGLPKMVDWNQLPPGGAGPGAAYLGLWNANTNTPTLSNGSGTQGDYYVVSVAGSTSLDGISSWAVGDRPTRSATAWTKPPYPPVPASVVLVTPAGGISSTDGLAALYELDAEKAPAAGSSSIVTVGTVTAGNTTATVSAATTALAGKVMLATAGDTSSTDKAVTPAILTTVTSAAVDGNARTITVRGQTAAAWVTANSVLGARELGIETDTRWAKVGDGATAWNSLAYAWQVPLTSAGAALLAAATTANTASTLMLRDAGGNTNVGTATDATHAVSKGQAESIATTIANAAIDTHETTSGAHGVDVLTESASRVFISPTEKTKLTDMPAAANVLSTANHVTVGTRTIVHPAAVASSGGVGGSDGFLSALLAEKLAALPSDAAALPTQISGGEITAGDGTSIRSFAPADVYDMIIEHAPDGGGSPLPGWAYYEATATSVDVLNQPASSSATEFLSISGGGLPSIPANQLSYDNAQIEYVIDGYRRIAAGTNGNDNASPTTWSAVLALTVDGTKRLEDSLSTHSFGVGNVPWEIRIVFTRRGSTLDVKMSIKIEAAGSTAPATGDIGNISGTSLPAGPWLIDYGITGLDFTAAIPFGMQITAPAMDTWTIPDFAGGTDVWNGSAATEPMFRWCKTQIDGRMIGAGPAGAPGANGTGSGGGLGGIVITQTTPAADPRGIDSSQIAIQAAIDSCVTPNNLTTEKNIFFPKGQYKVTSIRLRSGILYQGAGASSSMFVPDLAAYQADDGVSGARGSSVDGICVAQTGTAGRLTVRSDYMGVSGKQSFAIPRRITVTTDAKDLSSLYFQVCGVAPDFLPAENEIVITNGGTGYTSTPTVAFTGGTGTAPTAGTVTRVSNVITKIVLATPGTNPSSWNVTISGGGGTGATAVVGHVEWIIGPNDLHPLRVKGSEFGWEVFTKVKDVQFGTVTNSVFTRSAGALPSSAQVSVGVAPVLFRAMGENLKFIKMESFGFANMTAWPPVSTGGSSILYDCETLLICARDVTGVSDFSLKDLFSVGFTGGYAFCGTTIESQTAVQKIRIEGFAIHLGKPTARNHKKALSYDSRIAGQNDSPICIGNFDKGNNDGGGGYPDPFAIGKWFRNLGGTKGTTGGLFLNCCPRYVGIGIYAEEGALLTSEFSGYHEQTHHVVYSEGENWNAWYRGRYSNCGQCYGSEYTGESGNPAATAGQTDFTVTFPFTNNSDVRVKVNGTFITQAAGAGNFTVISGAGNREGGGVVRLGTASVAGDKVVIEGEYGSTFVFKNSSTANAVGFTTLGPIYSWGTRGIWDVEAENDESVFLAHPGAYYVQSDGGDLRLNIAPKQMNAAATLTMVRPAPFLNINGTTSIANFALHLAPGFPMPCVSLSGVSILTTGNIATPGNTTFAVAAGDQFHVWALPQPTAGSPSKKYRVTR